MKNTQHHIHHWYNHLLGVVAVVLLAGCGLYPTAQLPEQQDFEYLVTVKISASDSQEAIALQHRGAIISWNPDQGYAVVGSNEKRLSLQNTTASTNRNAASSTVVALGTSAWGNGTSAWANGTTAWANGTSALGSLQRNSRLWQLMGLSAAQSIASNLGSGVTVAVIDTGIDLNHPEFRGSLVAANQMYDFVDNDAVPQEARNGRAYGHGTAVAGVISQIAPLAKIMPLRVLNSEGIGDISDVIQAIDWARLRKVQVINLSLGTSVSDPLRRAIQAAANEGIYVVIASGNNGRDDVSFPASLARNNLNWQDGIVSVASATDARRRSSFSNVGKDLKLFAPGVDVWTAFPENRQAYWSGTSISTPMVSGTLALGLSYRPTVVKTNDTTVDFGVLMPYSSSKDTRTSISFLHIVSFIDLNAVYR